MRSEQSYGIIPLRLCNKIWEVLLIQHHSGHWSFPKGHAEAMELPLQAAERELKEETGLSIQHLLSTDALIEHYHFFRRGERVEKAVSYFPAIVTGEIVIQQIEIKSTQWVNLSEAPKHVTFKEAQNLCNQVEQFLKIHPFS